MTHIYILNFVNLNFGFSIRNFEQMIICIAFLIIYTLSVVNAIVRVNTREIQFLYIFCTYL